MDNTPMGAMLPTEIFEPLHEIESQHDDWIIQPKYDGHRVLIDLRGEEPRLYNRSWQPYTKPFPRHILESIQRERRRHLSPSFQQSYVIDGEYLPQTGRYWPFDQIDTEHLDTPLHARLSQLGWVNSWVDGIGVVGRASVFRRSGNPSVRLIFDDARRSDLCDGVVYKNLSSTYTPFHRTRLWRKYKFTNDIDVYVTRIGIDNKSNCEVSVRDPLTDAEFAIAKVSTSGKPSVKVGDVVTVRFLKFTGTSLREPRIVAVRDDKTALECTVDQLVPFLPQDA